MNHLGRMLGQLLLQPPDQGHTRREKDQDSQTVGEAEGHRGNTGLSKGNSVFSALWAIYFLLRPFAFQPHLPWNEPNHTRSVRDRSLFLKCYPGIQSRSGKFITTLGHQAKPLRIPGNPSVFFFKKKKTKTAALMQHWGGDL